MMVYEDVPLPSATADPRQVKYERGVKCDHNPHWLDIPRRERLTMILSRNCGNDDLDKMERHDPAD